MMRQRKRANQDAALAKQHKKLDREEAKKASNRLEYLFKQSPIFTKLKMGVGGINDDEKDSDDGDDDTLTVSMGGDSCSDDDEGGTTAATPIRRFIISPMR